MTRFDDPDDILGAWFDEGPVDLPSTTRRAITASLSTNRQTRRGLLAPWRFPSMISPMRAALGVAAIGLAIAGTAVFLREPSGTAAPGPTSSPAPTTPAPSPTLAAQTSQTPADWPQYTSAQYGFTIGYPSDWTLRKAFRPWSLAEDRSDVQLSPGADGFLSPDEELYVNAWAVALTADQSGPEWVASFCPTCSDMRDRAIEIDGRPGRLATSVGDFPGMAYVIDGDKVYVFAIWRNGYDALFEEFLSTVRLP